MWLSHSRQSTPLDANRAIPCPPRGFCSYLLKSEVATRAISVSRSSSSSGPATSVDRRGTQLNPALRRSPRAEPPAKMSVGALTTTFTPAPSCVESFSHLYINHTKNGAGPAIAGPVITSGCVPDQYDLHVSKYYSPGICPSGYAAACSSSNAIGSQTETVITCCPSYATRRVPYWQKGMSNSRGQTLYLRVHGSPLRVGIDPPVHLQGGGRCSDHVGHVPGSPERPADHGRILATCLVLCPGLPDSPAVHRLPVHCPHAYGDRNGEQRSFEPHPCHS